MEKGILHMDIIWEANAIHLPCVGLVRPEMATFRAPLCFWSWLRYAHCPFPAAKMRRGKNLVRYLNALISTPRMRARSSNQAISSLGGDTRSSGSLDISLIASAGQVLTQSPHPMHRSFITL